MLVLPYKVTFCTESAQTASASFPTRDQVDSFLPDETFFLSDMNITSNLWLFPNMTFECKGTVTEWRFRAGNETTNSPAATCPQFQTWRRGSTDAQFQMQNTTPNTTNCSCVDSATNDAEVCTYSLRSPIGVERGDFLGVVLPPSGSPLHLEFYSNETGSTRAYHGSTDNIDVSSTVDASTLTTTMYMPLIYPEIVVASTSSEHIYIYSHICTCVYTDTEKTSRVVV